MRDTAGMSRSPSKLGLWMPTAFCAFLSLFKLVLPDASDPAFYSFLPMCFFFSGVAGLVLWKRIDLLERRLAELEGGAATGES